MSVRIRLTILACALVGVGADCQQCQPPPPPNRGNLDRVVDAVLIHGSNGHDYVISANPHLEHLRVLDLTTGRFVTGPNRYFPLSIPTGPATHRLAVAVRASGGANSTLVLALDAGADQLVTVAGLDDESGFAPFVSLAHVDTARAPSDVAAIDLQDGRLLAAITIPDDSVVQTFLINVADGTAAVTGEVALPLGSRPDAIVADPLGESFVVGDASEPAAHVLRREDDGLLFDRSLVLRAPAAELSAGIVDVGDGLAPVVLVLSRDANEVALVRLFRAGFREERYAVLGSADLPTLPLAAYVPDQRVADGAPQATVCCRGLSDEAVAQGEATASWGAVALANGDLLYLNLAAPTDVDGRFRLRLIDDNVDGLGAEAGVDLNTTTDLWEPAPGGEPLRPTVTITATDTLGTPPHVDLLPLGAQFTLTWEGELPDATSLAGEFRAVDAAFSFEGELFPRGVRDNDIALLVLQDAPPGCAQEVQARIVVVDGSDAILARGAEEPFLDDGDIACLVGASSVTLTVEVRDAFVVVDQDGPRGRLAFLDAPADNQLQLPGAVLTIAAAAAGPPLPGSVLRLPLTANIRTMGLPLAAAPRNDGGGGFGGAALLPSAIIGGIVAIPGSSDDAPIVGRRMVLTSGSAEGGVTRIFTCDEAETVLNRVDSLR